MYTENINSDELNDTKTDCIEFLNIENEIPTKNIPTKYFIHNLILPIINEIENIIKNRVNNINIEISLHHVSLSFSTPSITVNRFTVSVDDDLTTINFEHHADFLFSDFIAYPLHEFEVSHQSIWYEFARYLSQRNDAILNITYEDSETATNQNNENKE